MAVPNGAAAGPILFERNEGQFEKGVDFVSRGPGYFLATQPGRALFRLAGKRGTGELAMAIEGSRADAEALAGTIAATRINYFLGGDQSKWRVDVESYESVRYRGIYDGIDVLYYGNPERIEYDFVVAPHIDPHQIALRFEGASCLSIDEGSGDLVILLNGDELRQRKPVAYQMRDGEPQQVDVAYDLQGEHRVAFRIGDYDPSRELVIDPEIVYATYVQHQARAVAATADGGVIVFGNANGAGYRTFSAIQPDINTRGSVITGLDTFVMKFDTNGGVVWATYLGGSGSDLATDVALDGTGNIYLAGNSTSPDMPGTGNGFIAIQHQMGSELEQGFFVKLSAAGNAILGGSFLRHASIGAIAVDASGQPVVTGSTWQRSFPATVARQVAKRSEDDDAFATKFSSDGSAIIYSILLGGVASENSSENGDVAVDSSGNAYVTGVTWGYFPTVNAAQPDCGINTSPNFFTCSDDLFVTKIDPAGNIVYSTYLGGSEYEFGARIAVTADGHATVVGMTGSPDFPLVNPFQSSAASTTVFVTRFSPTGSIVFSTYFERGSTVQQELHVDVAVDSGGNSVVAWQEAGDANVQVLNTSGGSVLYSQSWQDVTPYDVAAGAGGTIFLAGTTISTDVPIKDAWEPYPGQGFLAKFDRTSTALPTLEVGRIQPRVGRTVGGVTYFFLEPGVGESFEEAMRIFLGGSEVTDVNVTPTEASGHAPAHAPGPADITIQNPGSGSSATRTGGFFYVGNMTVTSISPAVVPEEVWTKFTITGTNFGPGIRIGGRVVGGGTFSNIDRVEFVNSTTVHFWTAFYSETFDIEVRNSNNAYDNDVGMVVVVPAAVTGAGPGIKYLDRGFGYGGDVVSIYCGGCSAATSVLFDGTPATGLGYGFGYVSVTTPAHVEGIVDVTLNTPGGSTTMTGAFRYMKPLPTFTSVFPTSGPPTGGTSVTITGTGFRSNAIVTIGRVLASDVVVVSDTTITCTTPAHATGQVQVLVMHPDEFQIHQSFDAEEFTYTGPVIGSAFPSKGSVAGGTSTSISVDGFVSGATVTFGGAAATVDTINPADIRVTTPPHASGFVDIVITNPNGDTDRRLRGFLYQGATPTITSISPNNGNPAGGTLVTIAGTGFQPGARVYFDSELAYNSTYVSSTTMTAVAPADTAGSSVSVQVTNPDETFVNVASGFAYNTSLIVSSISPASGPHTGGTTVTINGSGFVSGASVTFDGVAATGVTFVSATQLTAVTPAHAAQGGDVVLRVTNPDNQQGTRTFRYLPPLPTVDSFTPPSDVVGASITIAGTNFKFVSEVKFLSNKVASYTVLSPTQIQATVPLGAVTGPVSVTNATGTGTSSINFTVESSAPEVQSFTPPSAAAGATVVITGLKFTNASAVRFGGTNATTFTVDSSTQITATVPSLANTGTICVVTPNGTGCSTQEFIAFPRVSSFSPASGIPGATITVNGANFQNATQVGFTGGATAAPATVAGTGASLTVVVPAAATTGTVSVTTPAGTVTSTAVFTVPPAITSFSPAGGGPGTVVTINGARFTGATNVTFNGAAATFTVVSATVITATVPQAFAAAGKIVVTTPSGSATSAANFTTGPRITFVTPGYGLVGASVTIDGATFTGTTQVRFNGVAATFTIVSDTRITTTVPAGATSGPVSVTGPSGTGTSTNPFYLPPAITSFNPTSGYAGSTAVITGQNFLGTTNVTFNNVVSSFVVDSNTQITATVPGSAGTGPIRVHGFAATATGSTFTITAAPPPVLTAAAASATSVNVGWTGVAQQYDVQRSTNNSSWQNLARITAVSYTDNTALANTVYFYRVVRVSGGATSNSDLATTIIFTDDPLVAGSTAIKAIHLEQLRTAINLVRASAGLGAATWTDGSLAGVPVQAVHITEMRTALNAAVQTLTGSPLAFTDPSLAGIAAKAVHLQELRNPVK